jgi:hypothetical protein
VRAGIVPSDGEQHDGDDEEHRRTEAKELAAVDQKGLFKFPRIQDFHATCDFFEPPAQRRAPALRNGSATKL